jgi:hypothetical protein
MIGSQLLLAFAVDSCHSGHSGHLQSMQFPSYHCSQYSSRPTTAVNAVPVLAPMQSRFPPILLPEVGLERARAGDVAQP